MSVQVEKLEKNMAKLTIEVSAEEFEKGIQAAYLKEKGICTAYHYVPLHSSPAGEKFGRFSGEDVYTTKDSDRLLRLPMFYILSMSDVDYITDSIHQFEF